VAGDAERGARRTRAERSALFAVFLDEEARDQEPRQDEEDVDPDVAAREHVETGMEAHDQQDRDRPEPIDIGPVVVPGWRRDTDGRGHGRSPGNG
jgi:hypothetical protein